MRKYVPIAIGGMAKVGDIPHLSDDVSQELVNVFHRPGPRIEKRPAWKGDSWVSVLPDDEGAYMVWRDRSLNIDRLILNSDDLFVKNDVSEAWSAAIAGAARGVFDYANYHGAVYWMGGDRDDYPGLGVPPQRYSYDGTTLDIDPLRERLSSYSVAGWKDRLWFFNVFQYVLNRLEQASGGAAYGTGAGYAFTNVTSKSVTSNGVTTTHWVPTSLTSAKVEYAAAYTVPASSESTFLFLRGDFQGVSPLFRVPMALEIFAAQAMPRNTNVAVGTIRRPATPNGFRYRVVTAGVTAGVEPAMSATIGSDTADGAAVWHNDGVDAFNSQEFEVDNASENNGKFQTEGVVASIPPMPVSLVIGLRWKWGTTSITTWELQPVIVGLKDGIADGDLRKRNYGQQLTVGRFPYDFFNKQNAVDATINYPNRTICTEPGQPKEIRGDMFWEFVEGGQGGIVVGRPLREMMCIYKRNIVNVYQVVEGVAAARLPMRYVASFPGVGCIHQRAIGELDGVHYFIGEQGVYAFDGSSAPEDITSEEMREAVFDRDSGEWADDGDLRPLLRVDDKNKELRIYTQTSKVWIYGLRNKKWTSGNVIKNADGGTSRVFDMAYFREKFYLLAETNGPLREDLTATQDDVLAGGSFDVPAEVWLHPYEAIPRVDTLIEEIELHHDIDGVQGGSVLEVAVSFDRGATFPKEHEKTIPITAGKKPIRIPLWQSGANMTVRLRHTGKAGPSYFNVFWAGMWIQPLGEETNASIPATVSVSL